MKKYFCMAIALNGTKPETTDTLDRDIIAETNANALRQWAAAIADGKTPLELEKKDTLVLVAVDNQVVANLLRRLQN